MDEAESLCDRLAILDHGCPTNHNPKKPQQFTRSAHEGTSRRGRESNGVALIPGKLDAQPNADLILPKGNVFRCDELPD
jgi:ABC-type multidrug transport system ATPase subunit